MDDADLVRRVLGGDHGAYAPLVDSHAAQVYALCRAEVRRREEAENLAQEAMLRGLRGLASLKEPERFGPWLRGIARNLCRDWHKDPENKQHFFTDQNRNGAEEGGEDMDRPVESSQALEEWDELWAAVEKLPEECREVIWLYYTDERPTYQDLARKLDVSTLTVKDRLTRARRLLKDLLGDRFEQN